MDETILCDESSTSLDSCYSDTATGNLCEKETVAEECQGNLVANIRRSIPIRKEKSRLWKKCIQSLKTLYDQVYLIQDKTALAHTGMMIDEILSYTRKNQETENSLTLKDKTASPKMRNKKKGKRFSASHLLPKKKRNKFQKRFGAAAERKRAKAEINA